jgi:hypothetical protein
MPPPSQVAEKHLSSDTQSSSMSHPVQAGMGALVQCHAPPPSLTQVPLTQGSLVSQVTGTATQAPLAPSHVATVHGAVAAAEQSLVTHSQRPAALHVSTVHGNASSQSPCTEQCTHPGSGPLWVQK